MLDIVMGTVRVSPTENSTVSAGTENTSTVSCFRVPFGGRSIPFFLKVGSHFAVMVEAM